MSQCSGCNAVPRTFLHAIPLFGVVAAFPQRCATRAVNARVSSHAQVGRAKRQTETPRGKISLLEAEMLPDRKHILKKKVQIFTCSHTAGFPTQDWLCACDMTDVWALHTNCLPFGYERHAIISWNLPKCYSIWIIKYQRAEIGVTYTFPLQVIYFTFTIDSLFKWLRIDACWGWKTFFSGFKSQTQHEEPHRYLYLLTSLFSPCPLLKMSF